MDKYFIFVDNNLINGIFVLLVSIIITVIILNVCKKLFKFKCSPLIFFVLIITRLIIGGKIIRNENTKFINSSIHSVIIQQDEWRHNMYRNKLKNGMCFYTEDEVIIGDSIVKNANRSTYLKYKKDYNGNYVFVKEYTY